MARANRPPAKRRRLRHSLHPARDTFNIRWTGDGKLSAAVLDLIEPFRGPDESPACLQALISIAAIAWNLSLLPEEDREPMITDMAATLYRRNVPGGRFRLPILAKIAREPKEITEFKQLTRDLLKRRLQHYAEDRRVILGHKLLYRDSQPSLVVASGAPPDIASSFSGSEHTPSRSLAPRGDLGMPSLFNR